MNKTLNQAIKWSVLAAITVMAMPDVSMATSTDLNALINQGATQISPLPKIIGVACYAIGLIMIVSGAMKLKLHAEKPDAEKLAPAVARLGIGSMIAAAPYLTTFLQTSADVGTSAATFTSFGAVTLGAGS